MQQNLNSERLTSFYADDDGPGSSYLGMCAVVIASSLASVDCRACSGKGFRVLTEAELKVWAHKIAAQETTEERERVRRKLSQASDCQSCRGTGKMPARRGDHSAAMDSMWTTVRCEHCRGCSEVRNPTDSSAERQDVCLHCGGEGYIVPISVRSKGSSNAGGSRDSGPTYDTGPLLLATPDPSTEAERRLSERRSVAAELEALEARDPQLAAALASYHGPESAPWVGHRWGRAFVLWQHTTAGKQLAEFVAARSPQRSGYLVAVTERLAQARESVERPTHGPARGDAVMVRVLVTRADQEARAILRRLQDAVHTLELVA